MSRISLGFSVAALVIALAGTAIAGKRYVITSTSQIAPKVLSKLRQPTVVVNAPQGPAGANGKDGTAGAKGEQGETGAQGQPGLNGAARGYAWINTDGSVDPARSKNVVASERIRTATFCIQFGEGLTPDNDIAVATVDGFANRFATELIHTGECANSSMFEFELHLEEDQPFNVLVP